VYFDYNFTWIFHFKGTISFEFDELELRTGVSLKADQHGKLFPKVEAIKLDITKTRLYHEKKFTEWFFR